MNRARYVGLERGSTIVIPSRAYRGRRRAALEEALFDAYATGDGERVSRLRGELTQLEERGDA